MGDHSSVEVDAVVKLTVKSQERGNWASNTCSWGKKKYIYLYEYILLTKCTIPSGVVLAQAVVFP